MYLEEHVLLTGGQIHLVLVVIHADVDDIRQQLLIARDHFQLLMETLNSSPPLVSPIPAAASHPPLQRAPSQVEGPVQVPMNPRRRAACILSPYPQCWSGLLHVSCGREHLSFGALCFISLKF